MEFKELGIIEPILKAIALEGHTVPTPIQVKGIPAILSNSDVLGSAQTGTGKTATFAIPILQQIFENNKVRPSFAIKALILTPTRELATQVGEDFNTYSKYLKIRSTVIFGGVPQTRQIQALKRGVTVLVSTPGRLLDLISQGEVKLGEVEFLVLDEADQMLDMGFVKDVKRIIKNLPSKKQTLLFSATMPNQIIKLSNELLVDPIRVEVAAVHKTLDIIKQSVYHIIKSQKNELLVKLIKDLDIKSLLVFTRTKHMANRVVKSLEEAGITAEAIHGNKSQAARERALENFKANKTKVLVATDIASRGIDIEGLSHVINYDLPEVAETYIHRIGRTGRAGANGVAISFCDPENIELLKSIERHIEAKIDVVYNHDFQTTEVVLPKKDHRRNTNHKGKSNHDYRKKSHASGSKNNKQTYRKKAK